MNFDKAKDFGLIACVVCSLFVSAYFVPHGGGPGESRNIHVYAVEASDSTKGWVGDTDAVRLGVEAAIDDAATRTKVRLAGETISYDVMRNASALENMLSNPPERSVLINTHGECVPLPNSYLSPWVRIDSPSDGAVLNRTGGLTVQATVTAVIGTQLAGVGFAVVPTGCEPTTYYHMDPTGSGDHFDSVFYPLEVTGDYTALVRARTTRGLYACAYVNIHYIGKDNPYDAPYTAPGLYRRLCPYVYAGTYIGFVKDNTILAESNGSIVDRYRLENELEQDVYGNYLLRLSESGDKQSFFDYVQLLGVDHQRSVGIGLNSNGSVLTYEHPHLPLEAYAHEIGNAYFGIDVA